MRSDLLDRSEDRSEKDLRWPNYVVSASRGFVNAWEYAVLHTPFGWLLVAGVIAAYCVARSYAGLAGSRVYSHDAFFLLDGAWRMICHQRPQDDFSSMVGFLAYSPTLVGLWLSHGTVYGFGYGQALMGLVFSVWMYLLGRNRLLDAPLALMCVVVCFTAAAPFALGASPFLLSPGMTYNRYGYCLLALILVEAVCERRAVSNRSEALGGVSTGVIPAILFFFKITYFCSALFLLVTLIPCRRQTRARWIGILAGFAIVSLLCFAYYSFNLQPLFQDLTLLAHARHIHISAYFSDQILGDSALLFAVALSAGFLLLNANERATRSVLMLGAAGAVCGLLTGFGNYEFSGFALEPFVAILVIQMVLRYGISLPAPMKLFKTAVLAMASAMLVTVLAGSLLAIGAAVRAQIGSKNATQRMHSVRLSGFVTGDEEAFYVGFVNDGIDLLNRLRKPGETVMCLDFTNPFSYGLGIKSAPGGTNGLQYKSSFNDKYYQSPQSMFGSADLVIVPRHFSDGSLQDSVPRIYGPYLNSHFREIGESKEWKLYRRNS